MKKIILFTVFIIMALTFNTSLAQSGSKALVAWYSWGGNTETIGRYIAELTGADVFIIEPVEPYSSDYRTCTEEAKAEINAGAVREIKGRVADIGTYDTVIVGTPNWWSTMAPPVKTFLEEYDFSSKTILPFVTHGGGREARCFADMKMAADGAEFGEGYVVSGGSVRTAKADVEKWLRKSGLL